MGYERPRDAALRQNAVKVDYALQSRSAVR
jgi:hypothetical protein